MRTALILPLLAACLFSCSDYQKALKGTSVEHKLRIADSLYALAEKGNAPGASRRDESRAMSACEKAVPMLEELVQLTRGSAVSEKVYYYHAKCQYWKQDYILAYYYLSNFTRTFPASERAEECAFLSAICNFKNSPSYELDQTDTKAAIADMQLFVVTYPDSPLSDSATAIILRLRGKLELKDLNNARQYFRLRNYQGAITAFKEFNRVWPNSEFREEALFTILQASALLAEYSVEFRKEQRLKDAIQAYRNFADAFPESPDKREADRLHEELTAKLAQFANSTP